MRLTYSNSQLSSTAPQTADPDPVAWLDWRIWARAEAERKEAEEIKRKEAEAWKYVDYALSRPTEEWLDPPYVSSATQARYPKLEAGMHGPHWGRSALPSETNQAIEEALAEAMTKAKQLAKRYQEQAKANIEAAKREAEASEQRKQAQVDRWVENDMNALDQERYHDGLLPEHEILDSMRDKVFRPLDGFSRYERIKADAIEHEPDCMAPEFECESDEVKGLDAAAYEVFKTIRDQAPQHSLLTPRYHLCICDSCNASERRLSVMVTAQHGEFQFSREYALS